MQEIARKRGFKKAADDVCTHKLKNSEENFVRKVGDEFYFSRYFFTCYNDREREVLSTSLNNNGVLNNIQSREVEGVSERL